MIDPVLLFAYLAGGFVAATVSSVTGFGGAAILLPVTVAVFGVQDAIPILTIVQLIGNASRVWFHRGEIAWPVVQWFSVGCIPAAVLGSVLFARSPSPLLLRLLGLFLLIIVAWRHLPKWRAWRMSAVGFIPVGIVSGFLSALLGSVGPLVAPFFLSYGLVKSAYIGTEAFAAVIIHAMKTVTYSKLSLITTKTLTMGLLLGPLMILGSYVGKRIVDRVPEKLFVVIVDITMVIAGLQFLWRG